MNRVDRAYFQRRASAERKLGSRATHTDAARAHQRLAIEYEDRLRSGYLGLLSIDEDFAPSG